MSDNIYDNIGKIINKEFLMVGAGKLSEENIKAMSALLPEHSKIVIPGSRLKQFGRQILKMTADLSKWSAGKKVDEDVEYVKACAFVLGYIVHDVDLIPDFIPEVGELDDAILVKVMIDVYPDRFSL